MVIDLSSIGSVIQLAVAPVFLLTGVGSFLAVLTNRLARIVDRVRVLRAEDKKLNALEKSELKLLSKRVRLINTATGMCTFSALMVCWVIVALFGFHFFDIDAPMIIAGLFVAAMLSLIVGLLLFQGEIFLATRTVKIMQL